MWLELRFTPRANGLVATGVSDSEGALPRMPDRAPAWQYVDEYDNPDLPPVVVPVPVLERLARLVEQLPTYRHGDDQSVLTSVPLVLAVPAAHTMARWDSLVRAAARDHAGIDPERVTAVVRRARMPGADPFELPLNVVTVGDVDRQIVPIIEDRHAWLGGPADLQASVAAFESVTDAAEVAALRTDIVVLDGSDAAALDRRRGQSIAARLAVVLGDEGPTRVPVALLRGARSVIRVEGPRDDRQTEAVGRLFEALSHDSPIHEAVMEMRRAAGLDVRLHGTAASMHDLRLSDAVSALARDAFDLAARSGEVVVNIDELQYNFDRESHGLRPVAEGRNVILRARDALRRVVSGGGPGKMAPRDDFGGDPMAPRDEPDGPDDATDAAPRVVNVGLRRLGVWAPASGQLYLDAHTSLAVGGTYLLDVQIGARWPSSLVQGEQVSIDDELPDDPDGHDLEVAVFPAGLGVDGAKVQPLFLPERGASDLITFRVRAPRRATRAADLRIGIYHRDNLVQTYLVTATVAPEEGYGDDVRLRVELDHSTTAQWGNVASLAPRLASITVNETAAGRHRIYVKEGNKATSLPFATDTAASVTKTVREALVAAVKRQASPDDTLWALARAGNDVFEGVFNRVTSLQDTMRAVIRSEDEIVQVVRIDLHTSLPWPTVYDWGIPELAVGAARPTACFGTNAAGEPCGHTRGAPTVCALGFWGVRHRVEELLAEARSLDAIDHVPRRPPVVSFALGVPDAPVVALPAALQAVVGAGAVSTLTAGDDLLDSLFDEAQRPSVLVVIGHHETKQIQGEPDESRIVTGTSDRWLMASRITRRAVDDGNWTPPNSVVLLLSCGSVAVEPVELTSFLAALHGAGAVGVVGTECNIYASDAASFATELIGALAANDSFAVAVRKARRSMVMKGDPVGFAFSAFGPADTALVDA
ncbi:MAG TPA: CHAT domain-containing protein [Acidimicrobiales bacterium]